MFSNSPLIGQSSLKKGDDHFKELKFRKAAGIYEQALLESPGHPELLERLADSYFMIGDYTTAGEFYQKLLGIKGNSMSEMKFLRLVLTLKASGNEHRGNELLAWYYKENNQKREQLDIQQKAMDESRFANYEYLIWPLSINSTESDFAPMFYKEDLVFASSRKKGAVSKNLYQWNNQPYLDLYLAISGERGQDIEQVVSFQQGEGYEFHEASICFSRDYETVYFTQNHLRNNKLQVNKNGQSTMRILKGRMEGNTIVDATPLPFNDPEYSCGHPSLDPEGKFLYFSSDMPGGYGQSDLYRVAILDDGGFGKPENLGPHINTPGREMFPFLIDNRLYFSSDGHFGLGGLDIYEISFYDETTSKTPLNVGSPINTAADDFSLIMAGDGTGYFASNRELGDGDDDIFFFKKLAPLPEHDLYGRVFNLQDQRPIPHVSIKIKDETGRLVSETQADLHGIYKVDLEPEEGYSIEYSREGYTLETIELAAEEVEAYTNTRKDIYLLPYEAVTVQKEGLEQLKVNPIYFVTGKSSFTKHAKDELNKVVYILNNFPHLRIRIEAHTDARGAKASNLRLSQDRANAVMNYLFEKGIPSSQVIASIGYGESRLLNDCGDEMDCSDEEHEENRRCNFVVVKE